jgi:transcriptional regulator with XRE-family HTH domain
VPLINQPLVPDTAVPGGAGFTLTVSGTGFVSGSVMNWNGSPMTTAVVSGSQLTASVLSLIERGRNAPSSETLDRIAHRLKLPVAELFKFDASSGHHGQSRKRSPAL